MISISLITQWHGNREILRVTRRPEWLHALETLMQNAKQFALHEVNIHISWTEENINVSIVDDGAGFSPSVLAHAGQPGIAAGQVRRAPWSWFIHRAYVAGINRRVRAFWECSMAVVAMLNSKFRWWR